MGERVKSANPDVAAAQELYHKDKTNWDEVYSAAREDLQFYKGGTDQWDSADLRIRNESRRPSLTTNMLPQFVHQVVNDQRMNVPQQKVLPIGDGADLETAKTIQGLFKNIEYTSNAPMVYDTAADCQVKCSLGWIRVDHDYTAPDSFEQHIVLKRVVNPLSVIIDSSSIECDGSDAKHGFVLDTYSEDEFKAKWPKCNPISFDDLSGTPDEQVVVAEFFKLVPTEIAIGLFPGNVILELGTPEAEEAGKPLKVRTIIENKVKRQWLSGDEVLEEGDFPGSYIPLVPVYGEEHWIDGKRHLFSLIRHMKDPQRMVNYWSSLATELLQKSPQAPFMAPEGAFEGHEDDWRNPGAKMVLQYKATDVNGQPIPAPIRVAPPPVPTGVMQARQSAIQDMRDACGIQQAGLGQRSNETSGIAISNRVREGDVSNMHFGDNLNRSIAHVGRIELSMMKEIYDTPRLVRILNDEDETEQVGINGALTPEQEKTFDINVGRYDVAIVTGPSFTTRRQETQQMMEGVVRAAPQLLSVMGDLMFKYSDVPGSDVIAKRLKKILPPQLQDDEGQQQIPPQLQQQLMQMQQQTQQLQAALQEATSKLNSKQMELESQERIALDNNQTKMVVAAIGAKSAEATALLNAETKHIMQRLGMLHDNATAEAQNAQMLQQQAQQQTAPAAVAPQAQ